MQISFATLTHRPATPVAEAFDIDGFLLDSSGWNAQLAQDLAAEVGIDRLTAKHWEVIDLVRGQFFALGQLPVMRLICRRAGVDPQGAHSLFPSCRALWRIAGLPNPGEEAKAYMN